jgi:2,4-dienoyl-CoA reductase-like NADH-dependent reductase (Old Yellow Enzyme family)
MYILGSTAISPEGISAITQPRAFSESDLSSLSERANIIKSQGALAILQINHRGALATKQLGLPPVAPSAKIAKKLLEIKGLAVDEIHELTDNEIKKLIDKFAYSTELAIKAGYNGIEIHGANTIFHGVKYILLLGGEWFIILEY